MDTSKWRPMECGDWRSQLQAASRKKIVNTITNALKNRVPLSGHEAVQAPEKTAVLFEEENYTTATSLVDYLQKVSLKMQTLEAATSHNPMPAVINVNPSDSVTGEYSLMEPGDWRSQLQADSRKRIVNKIIDTLKRHLPFSGHEGLQELEKIAVRFEEKIYVAATSQSAYLRKISLKMLSMETRSQNPMPNAIQSNSGANSVKPSDPGTSISQNPMPIAIRSDSRADTVNPSDPAIGGSSVDWRLQLHTDSRQRIVNKIMDTLKRRLPFSGPEGLQALEKIAVTFEDKIYTAATSQSDYLRKISLKMLTMENTSQNPMPDAMKSNFWC